MKDIVLGHVKDNNVANSYLAAASLSLLSLSLTHALYCLSTGL
jgi:hypothetical protein